MVRNKNYEVRVSSNDARFMPSFSKIQQCFRIRIGVTSYVILSLFAKEGKQANTIDMYFKRLQIG